MTLRAWAMTTVSILLLSACRATTEGGDCRSHYTPVARASTLAALTEKLADHVSPRIRSVHVVGHRDGKRVVNLLNGKGRTVISLDVWQSADGSWKAGPWMQCID